MKPIQTILTAFMALLFLSGFAQESSQENPFEKYGYKPKIATLSKGKYIEFFDRDTIVHIGKIVFNTRSKKIIGFIETDTLRNEATLEPDLVSRWLSPDPLASEAPGWTPYRYGFSNPVNFIDPTGLYEDHWQVDDDGNATLLDTEGDDIYVNDKLLSEFDFTGKEGALADIGTHYYNQNFSNNKYHLANNEASVFSFEKGKFEGAYNSPNKPRGTALLSVHPAKISEDGLNHLNFYTFEGRVSPRLNNKFNLINHMSHERTHFIQGTGGSSINELEAYFVQTLHWSWSKTTEKHRNFTLMNSGDYLIGLRNQGTIDPTIRAADKKYYFNTYLHYKSLLDK